MSTPTVPLPSTDWEKLCDALYPNLTEAERKALTGIWEVNYRRYAPLKSRLDATLDPDVRFDPQP